jgi:putative peptide zinc metalloprotease protein
VQRLAVPREKTWAGAGRLFDRLYRCGGWRLFTRPALVAIAVLVVAGLAAFPYLVIGRYGTPFIVAHKVGVGALIFLVGRLAVVAVHETAHGLTMASYGRRVRRAGIKVVLIFPYAFVDTSEAWFEPRRRRIAISAAGPVSDLSLGALFALGCLALPAGTIRDILFQLAFAAYVGAFFNLNPLVERDGYQILVDLLGEPGLRRRAREQLFRRLSGQGRSDDSPVLARYAGVGLAWSVLAACIAAGLSLRYEARLAEVASAPVVWGVLAVLWVGFFLPVIAVIGRPLRARRRSREA